MPACASISSCCEDVIVPGRTRSTLHVANYYRGEPLGHAVLAGACQFRREVSDGCEELFAHLVHPGGTTR